MQAEDVVAVAQDEHGVDVAFVGALRQQQLAFGGGGQAQVTQSQGPAYMIGARDAAHVESRRVQGWSLLIPWSQAWFAIPHADGSGRVVGAWEAAGRLGEQQFRLILPVEAQHRLAGPEETLIDDVRLPRLLADAAEHDKRVLVPPQAVETEALTPGSLLRVLTVTIVDGKPRVHSSRGVELVAPLCRLGGLPHGVVCQLVLRVTPGEIDISVDCPQVLVAADLQAGKTVQCGRPAMPLVQTLESVPCPCQLAGTRVGAAEHVLGTRCKFVPRVGTKQLAQIIDGATVVAVAVVDLGPYVAFVPVSRTQAARHVECQAVAGKTAHQFQPGLAGAGVVAAQARDLADTKQNPRRCSGGGAVISIGL